MLTNNLLDILVLSETKIDDSYPDSQFDIKGFKLYIDKIEQVSEVVL